MPMIERAGKYNTAKVFTNTAEQLPSKALHYRNLKNQ